MPILRFSLADSPPTLSGIDLVSGTLIECESVEVVMKGQPGTPFFKSSGKIRDVTIRGGTWTDGGPLWVHTGDTQVSNARIEGVRAEDCEGVVDWSGAAASAIGAGCRFVRCGDAVVVGGTRAVAGLNFCGVYWQGCQRGVVLRTGHKPRRVTLQACTFDGLHGAAVVAGEHTYGLGILDCYIEPHDECQEPDIVLADMQGEGRRQGRPRPRLA